jgi:PAS domain S-box-containing protein
VAALERERLARLEAENALRESEARYRELIDQCPEPVVVHRDGVLLFVNHAAVRLAGGGFEPRDLVGRHVLDFVHPEQRALSQDQLARVSAGETPLEMVENRVTAPDGRDLEVESVERVIQWEGKPAVQVVVRDVSAQKRAERELQAMQRSLEERVVRRTEDLSRALAELRTSEERHRALVEATPDLLGRIAADGTILDLHTGPFYASLLRRDVVGRKLADVLPPHMVEAGPRLVAKICRSGRSQSVEVEIPTPEGPRQVEVRFVPSGKAEVLALLRDISERKQAEDSLRRSEARQRALLEGSPDSLIRIARDGTLLDVHAGADLRVRLAPPWFVGRSLAEFLPPDRLEWALGLLDRTCASGRLEVVEYTHQRETGAVDTYETRLVPTGDDEILAIVRDVTERRAAEDALRDSEERFRLIFEEGPLGMALVGADLRLVKVNRTLAGMLGRSADDLCSRKYLALTHPDDVASDKQLLRQLGRDVIQSFTIEKRVLGADGEALPVRVTGTLIRDDDGAPRYGIAMFEDIREKRRAEADLARAQERLQNAERLASIGTLAAGIAHEINTPIGSILLASRYLQDSMAERDADEDERRGIEDVVAHAHRCARIVKSVLQFAGQEAPRPEPCDLEACVQGVRDLARHVAEAAGAEVRFRAAAEPLPVRVSRTAIEQVLLNLIRNAVEAGETGGEVEVRTEAGPGVARVAVRDRGRGMSAEEKTFLFDPFYTTRRAEGGTGLGLSISHGIVTDHGGTIRVESQPGSGTTLTVELPLCPDGSVEENS